MASLHVAVLFGDKELARSLLEEGSDVNTYDQRLGTPLSIAVLKGYWSIAKVLHEHGADHTSDQFTSALIHSSIDNFNLPDLAATSGRAERSANRDAKLQDHGSASSRRGRRNIDSIGCPEAWQDAIESSDDELVGPNNVITTLYIRDGKLEETPTGTGPWPDRVPSESAGDDQDFCSILDIKDLNDDLQWVTYDILIRGRKLCRFISGVLEDYPGTSYHPSKIRLHATTDEEIDPAFVGLFHKSEDYVRICEEEGDHVTKAQAELLLKCLNPLWQLLHVSVDESKATGLMKWDQLWAIYDPGQTVVIKKATGLSAARVKEFNLVHQSWNDVNALQITVDVVDWNGAYTGYAERYYSVEQYDGFKQINDLGIFPISYASDPGAIQKRLVERGRKFESLRGCFFMTRRDRNIERRVIIDNYAYYRFENPHAPSLVRLDDQSRSRWSEHSSSPDETLPSASTVDGSRSTSGERDVDLRPLTDDECLLCVATMNGFELQEKEWNQVNVEGLQSVTWNDEAFTNLTMQDDQKRLILAFTKQKQIEEMKFDDFIVGKGKSLIILLCGPPGVGKTLTAESVAERSRAPLYTMSAGDLGTDASSVEHVLKGALEMCSHWKAVMLIDEADVFLEARKSDNLQRNELVSVFLRLLEYYKGTLFLTTNRASTIDTAFESRIDLIIPYEDLDQAARLEVWHNFAKRSVGATHGLCEEDFEELGHRKLNGREIKSTMKTALMLATSEGQTLQLQHLNVVLNIRQRAADYLYGGDQQSMP